MVWQNASRINSVNYQCGYCDNIVASSNGFYDDKGRRIYICPHCENPTYIFNQVKVPNVSFGGSVLSVPEPAASVYEEARKAYSAGCFTASVLLCRKLLMNIAVSQGEAEGQSFIKYINYLCDKGYVPPNGRGWVDHIRNKGNEATHEIALMNSEHAEELINFSEMLLKFIYEFPAKIPKT